MERSEVLLAVEIQTTNERKIMNRMHISRDGKRLFISQMDNSHLVNTLKLLCKKVSNLKQVAEGVTVSKNAMIYGLDTDSTKKEARRRLVESVRFIEPYAAECALRGMDVAEILQSTFDRCEAEEITMDFMTNRALQIEDDEDLDDDQDFDLLNQWD